MAKAKKLPSGSWRTQVYDYTDENKKRHYESFTATTKKESEYMAAEYMLNKKRMSDRKEITLNEAINIYIEEAPDLSPTTIQGYRSIQSHAFQDILELPLKKITKDVFKDAMLREANRISERTKKKISAKTVHNEYTLMSTMLKEYCNGYNYDGIHLPKVHTVEPNILTPEAIYNVVKDTDIELPAMLAMWLSFSASEIKGLKKSSIKDGYISINQVVVRVNNTDIEKKDAKAKKRKRTLKVPDYIMGLIDDLKIEDNNEYLETRTASALNKRFTRILHKNNLPHMTFHGLRHVNASVMALLRVPDVYAQDRGGWSTDHVMKKVYTHAFDDERVAVDDKIDKYFLEKISHEISHDKSESLDYSML